MTVAGFVTRLPLPRPRTRQFDRGGNPATGHGATDTRAPGKPSVRYGYRSGPARPWNPTQPRRTRRGKRKGRAASRFRAIPWAKHEDGGDLTCRSSDERATHSSWSADPRGGVGQVRASPVGYVVSVVAVAASLLLVEWARVGPQSLLEFAYLAMVGTALVPLAILLVGTVAYLALPRRSLLRARITEWPRAAVLYVACNDTLPEAILLTLRQLDYENAEVWLLTDSDRSHPLAAEATLPPTVRIFRRPSRRGGKAGIINDWLAANGDRVRYVVPMDADAILAQGALRRLVEIAEDGSNRRYAGFQCLMEIHPLVASTVFAQTMGRAVKWGTRILPLANQRLFGQAMYWGSNALLRVEAVRSVGGWAEDVICEDYALTARLDAAGYPIALVDVYCYEGFPPDALSLRERTVRWCKANLSILRPVLRSKTGFPVRLNLLIPLLFYLMAPVLLALLLMSIFFPLSVLGHRSATPLGATLLAFVVLHRLAVVPLSSESLHQFFATALVETVVVLGMSLRVTFAFIEYAVAGASWNPSRKKPARLSLSSALRASWPELGFGLFLMAAVFLASPPLITTVLAGVWILSFLAVPVVLWSSSLSGSSSPRASHRPSAVEVALDGDPP